MILALHEQTSPAHIALITGLAAGVVQLGNYWLARRKQSQAERIDPMAAAAQMTEQMASAVGVLVEPLRMEIQRLRTEIDLQRDEIQFLTHQNQALKLEVSALRAQLAAKED